jgi:5-methylcytosine-specific restriction endonuclease McrA
MLDDTNSQKRCCTCGETKPRDMFDKNKGRRDGFSERCKPCRAAYRATNAQHISEYNKVYKQTNAEAISESNRIYHATHAEAIHERHRAYKQTNAGALLEYGHAYYAAHAEERRAYALAYIAAHYEERRAYSRAYLAANPEISLAANHRRRARIKANGGSFTAQQIKDLRVAQGGCCAYCARQAKLTIDHIIPLKQGGSNDISNICLACRRCNFTKNARTPEQWTNRWYEK